MSGVETKPFSVFGEYTPPFRTVKRHLECEWPGCTATMPYKHGRPNKYCQEHRSSRGIAARESHDQRRQAAARERSMPSGPSPVELAAAQLTAPEILAFLKREGIATYTNHDGWNQVLTPWGTFDAHRALEMNIAAALMQEPGTE